MQQEITRYNVEIENNKINANQLFITAIICILSFLSLSLPYWIQTKDIHAGVWTIVLDKLNCTINKINWSSFCNQSLKKKPKDIIQESIIFKECLIDTSTSTNYNYGIHPSSTLCDYNNRFLFILLLLSAVLASALSLIIGIYIYMNTKPVGKIICILPVNFLLLNGLFSIVIVIFWDHKLRHPEILNHTGFCYNISIASIILAFCTSISMFITLSFPGLCDTQNKNVIIRKKEFWETNDERFFDEAAQDYIDFFAGNMNHVITPNNSLGKNKKSFIAAAAN